MKKKLLVSFSGGETSAFMAQWLWKHKQDEYEMIFVFANTGLENEETFNFIGKCSEHFGFHIYWIEAKVYHDERKSSGFVEVDIKNTSSMGEPFEEVIKKYGISNMAFPHCTRELKQNPMMAFAKDIWDGEEYYTAIGIRADEIDRVNAKWKEKKFIYPLASPKWGIPITKSMINFYWDNQPFRLELKGYQGNCITCWKKSDKKLFQIAKENPTAFDFMLRMEKEYPEVGAEFKKDINAKSRTFFRENRSAKDIIEQAKNWDGKVIDDSEDKNVQLNLDLIGGESCEIFSECG